MQANPKAGLTFAAALRSILRSDPDVVLLGEIRDRETAHIAVEAALTGHLVLSTLHTNDAPPAIVRLRSCDRACSDDTRTTGPRRASSSSRVAATSLPPTRLNASCLHAQVTSTSSTCGA